MRLKAGDVIRFDFPYSARGGKQPHKLHYAIVLEPSPSILGYEFPGRDCLELTHYRAERYGTAKPEDTPYLCRDSFTQSYRQSDRIRNMFLDRNNKPDSEGRMPSDAPANTYKYSVPAVYDNRITVCSVHPDATLKDYTYIGSLQRRIYNKFLDYYNRHKKNCTRMVIDRDSEVYELEGRYLIDAEGRKCRPSVLEESLGTPCMVIAMLTEEEIRAILRSL